MTAGYSTIEQTAGLSRLDTARYVAVTKRAQDFAASLRTDFAEWSPSSEPAQLVGELVEWLDTLGDIVTELDYTASGVSTTREDDLRETADSAGYERGADDASREQWEQCRTDLRGAIEQLGEDAEHAGQPVVIADRWDAINLAEQIRARIEVDA